MFKTFTYKNISLDSLVDKNHFIRKLDLCPNNQVLKYSTTKKQGYREYKSNSKIYSKYQYEKQCTQSKNYTKIVTHHVWEIYIEEVEDIRHQIGIKEIYKKRKEMIERVFEDAKKNMQ